MEKNEGEISALVGPSDDIAQVQSQGTDLFFVLSFNHYPDDRFRTGGTDKYPAPLAQLFFRFIQGCGKTWNLFGFNPG